MPGWPRHQQVTRQWRQAQRGGTRADRMLSSITVAVPPLIAHRQVPIDAELAVLMESAIGEIVALDQSHGDQLEALGVLLLRTESVASSKIESVEASLDDYARALHGSRANASAWSMVAATSALERLIKATEASGEITEQAVLAAHLELMRDDQAEQAYAGRLREMQNWIGGSDHSPRNALYVPPPPDRVQGLLTDLLDFANRGDVPVLAQAAVTHAQFESVHPFTDGNGRIGRGLINAVLRRRRTTTRVIVPLASALVAHRERYFDQLTAYREGDPRQLVSAFAAASLTAAVESRATARRLAEIPQEWASMAGRVRAGSAVAKLIPWLLGHPVVSAEDVVAATSAPTSSVYSAIERLEDTGVLRRLTERQRGQVWGAGLVLDELDDLGARIAAASQ